MELTPIKSTRMVEEVLRILEDQILNGKIKDGDKLPSEEQLAALLGVGRRPVREALKILEAKGLIEIQMGIGATVKRNDLDSYLGSLTRNISSYLSLNRADLNHVMELRWLLEWAALEHLATHPDDEKINSLEFIVAKQREAYVAKDFRVYQDWHFRFHKEIITALENPVIEMIHRQILAVIYELMERAGRRPQITIRAIDDHQLMVEALKYGKTSELKKILDEHLLNAISNFNEEKRKILPKAPEKSDPI